MGYDRGGRPVLPDLALPPDSEHMLPDLGRPTGTVSVPPDEYRPLRGPRRISPPARPRDEDRPLPPIARAILLGIPSGMIVVASLLPNSLLDLIPISAIPLPLLLMLLSQIGGWIVGRSSGARPIARICLMNLVVLGIVLPILALQAAAARVPYVSTDLDTATPATVATTAAVISVIGAGILAVVLAWDGPESAGLLCSPVAFVVPAILGASYNPPVSAYVERIREVFAAAVILTICTAILPQLLRLLAPPAFLALFFLALWALGRGPTFQPTSGNVVRVLDGSLLVVSVTMLVAVPICAILIRRIESEMRRPIAQ